MRQTRHKRTENLAERWCGEVTRRDDARVARRLDRNQEVAGGDRLDAGAVVDEVCHVLPARGVMALLEEAHGAALQRERLPWVPSVWRSGLQTVFGLESSKALPRGLGNDEALRQLVGFNAQQVRPGVGQRGAPTRPGERSPGPLCPDTLAKHRVQGNLRALAAVFNGRIRALAPAGGWGKRVPGIAAGPALETTARDRGGGRARRQVRIAGKHGQMHDMEVTVYGGKGLLLIEAGPKLPWAVKVGPIQEHEARWARALVTQARLKLAGEARLANVVFAQGVWDGPTRWGGTPRASAVGGPPTRPWR